MINDEHIIRDILIGDCAEMGLLAAKLSFTFLTP